jgi:hypothetical protein
MVFNLLRNGRSPKSFLSTTGFQLPATEKRLGLQRCCLINVPLYPWQFFAVPQYGAH